MVRWLLFVVVFFNFLNATICAFNQDRIAVNYNKGRLEFPSKAPRVSDEPFIVGNNQCCDNSELKRLLNQLMRQCQNNVTTGSCVCSPIAITESITITNPGFYCLANDIVGNITVVADNVIINLNNHSISSDGASVPLVITAGSHRIIYNGSIAGSPGAGIQIDANTLDTQLNFLSITDCGIAILGDSVTDCFIKNSIIEACGEGIEFTGTNNTIGIQDFSIFNTLQNGINTSSGICTNVFIGNGTFDSTGSAALFLGDITNLHLNAISVENVRNRSGGIICNGIVDVCLFNNVTVDSVGTFGFSFADLNNGIIQNCHVFNGVNSGKSLGFFVTIGFSNQFINCSANHLVSAIEFSNLNRGPSEAAAFFVAGGDSMQFVDCVANRIFSGNDNAFGFHIDSASNISFRNCTAQFISGQGGGIFESAGFALLNTSTVRLDNCQILDAFFEAVGFIVDASSSNIVMDNCLADGCAHEGFVIDGTENSLTNCQAVAASTGFLITGTSNVFNYCQSNFNRDTGFSSVDATNFFGNCSAIKNSNNGFLNGSLYHCFASQNGTDYNGITGPTSNVNAIIFGAGANLFF